MRIDVWADLVCPWCYLGKRRLEQALRDAGLGERVQVVTRSFELDPTLPPGEVFDQAELLMRKYRRSETQVHAMMTRLEQLAAQDGLTMRLVGGKAGNTFAAHRLVHLGRARGREEAVLERLYRAHFTEQRSIFDTAALVALAGEAGLDPGEARRVLEGDDYAEAVRAEAAQAAALGAGGVPFFVFDGRYAVSGAQPPELLREVLEEALAASSA